MSRFVIASALLLLASLAPFWSARLASAAGPTPWPQFGPPLMCTDHPCSGDAYEVVYRVSDGQILSLTQYDPCGPPWFDCEAKKPVAILQPGEDWVNLNGDPRVGEVMKDFTNFRVDVNTREVIGPLKSSAPVPGAPAESADSSEGGAVELGWLARYLLPALGLATLGIVTVTGVRRRPR